MCPRCEWSDYINCQADDLLQGCQQTWVASLPSRFVNVCLPHVTHVTQDSPALEGAPLQCALGHKPGIT